MRPWEDRKTIELFRRMSGSESLKLMIALSEDYATIFANSLGKDKPDARVYSLIRGEHVFRSKKS
jgi:hypothetical protein